MALDKAQTPKARQRCPGHHAGRGVAGRSVPVSGSSEEHMMQIHHTGGFQPVITPMANFPDDPMIQMYGQHIIATAAEQQYAYSS